MTSWSNTKPVEISNISGEAAARLKLFELAKRLEPKIGLAFALGIQATTREVRTLIGGVMTFIHQ